MGSAVHIRNLDVFVAMVRLFVQRWQMLSGKGSVSSAFAPDAGGFKDSPLWVAGVGGDRESVQHLQIPVDQADRKRLAVGFDDGEAVLAGGEQ